MKKTFKSLVFLFLAIIIFNSCASTREAAIRITVESGEIPPDMKKEDFTLIGILKGRRSRDKYTRSEFKKYTGNYVLCKQKDLDTEYSDVNKYRYVMDFNVENSGYGPNSYISDRYYIIDRKEDKVYMRLRGSSFFKLEIRAYLTAIEFARKK